MDIIVVEDQEDVRKMLCTLLKKKGHNVIIAENGKRAIELLSVYNIDLVITDIIMPEIEGIELILRLYESKIPIIPVSVLTKGAIVQELLDALGIIGVLQKPFNNDELIKLVESVDKIKYKK
jgi:two-component system response regulator GlrR